MRHRATVNIKIWTQKKKKNALWSLFFWNFNTLNLFKIRVSPSGVKKPLRPYPSLDDLEMNKGGCTFSYSTFCCISPSDFRFKICEADIGGTFCASAENQRLQSTSFNVWNSFRIAGRTEVNQANPAPANQVCEPAYNVFIRVSAQQEGDCRVLVREENYVQDRFKKIVDR